jgi:adenosylcobinamide kinase / adenosylcobinamide-phosphate guanylyltransferase
MSHGASLPEILPRKITLSCVRAFSPALALLPIPAAKVNDMTDPFPKLTLVTGGAASGKSVWAEGFVRQSNLPKTYLATAQSFDDEMAAKIMRHRGQRGDDWHLVEAPLDLATALNTVQAGIVLVDCLTMWLSNHLLAENEIEPLVVNLLATFETCPARIVMVTNEVGQSVVPDNPLARQFQAQQGRLNQQIAQQADLVVAVMSGLPLALKGDIPKVAP